MEKMGNLGKGKISACKIEDISDILSRRQRKEGTSFGRRED
jgi:hypothetical protein